MNNKVIFAIFVCRGIKHRGRVLHDDYVSQPVSSPVYELNTRNIIMLRNYALNLRLSLMSVSTEVKVRFVETHLF